MSTKLSSIVAGILLAILFSTAVLIGVRAVLANDSPTEISESLRTDYRIVYLTDSGEEDQLLTPEKIGQEIGADTRSNWDKVSDMHRQSNLDALILNRSSFDDINVSQLREMYREGVVIAVFNTYAPELSELLSDHCIGRDSWMDGVSEPIDGDFYIIASRFIQGSTEDIARIQAEQPCSGESISGIESEVHVVASLSANSIMSLDDLNAFFQVLTGKIDSIRLVRSQQK